MNWIKKINRHRNNTVHKENYSYVKTILPTLKDVVWEVKDNALALGGVSELVDSFISENWHEGYTLSIYDAKTHKVIEVKCPISVMPKVVDYIYNLENGTPLTFIGANHLAESYVVEMSISRGLLDFGDYTFENGELKKIPTRLQRLYNDFDLRRRQGEI